MARSIRKGPYVDPSLLEKIAKVKLSSKRDAIKTWKRASTITPDFVGLIFAVHDGRKFISVFVTENMVGHCLGEFAPTRIFRQHSGQRKADKTGAKPGGSATKAGGAAKPGGSSGAKPSAK